LPDDPFAASAQGYAVIDTAATPVRHWCEDPTVLAACGDVIGLSVLEAACSDGHFARLLRDAGAARIHGVDLSPAMIALARQRCPDPAFSFQICDLAEMEPSGPYDLALLSYALTYAADRQTLGRMARRVADCLAPGGRIVALVENPDLDPAATAGFARYGKSKYDEGALGEVRLTRVCWHQEGADPLCFTCHRWPEAALVETLSASGFRDITLSAPVLPQASRAAWPDGFWDDLEAAPLFAIVTATRG